MKKKEIGLLLVLYLGWPLYQVIDYTGAQPMASTGDDLNFVASILAYNWLLLNVLLGLKLPWFQGILPYDFRIRAHILTSLVLVAFLGFHGTYYLFITAKQIDLVTWGLLGVMVAFFTLGFLWVPVPGLGRFREWANRGLRVGILRSYDTLKAFHKGLFVALAGVTYVHVLDAKVIGVASPASGFGFQFLFVAVAAAYGWTRVRNLTLPTLEVVSVARHGSITRLALGGPSRVGYRPGQFAYLRFCRPDLRGEEHPFSFISAPHEERLEFAVKGKGDFTRKLESPKPGDQVKINGGFGSFGPENRGTPLVFVGTGIGLAPILSLVKGLADRDPARKIFCILAARTREELVDLDRIEALAQRNSGFQLRTLVSAEGAPRIDASFVRQQLGEPRAYEYYLCSSEKVLKDLESVLGSLGVKPGAIHHESF